MGDKAIIRLGDRTSHGGSVVEGNQLFLIHGKPVAGVGHKVHCPKCSGNITIVEGAVNATMMGISVAVEGMKTSCGATLIASQITETITYGSGTSSSGTAPAAAPQAADPSTIAAAAATTAAARISAGADAARGKYDEQVRIVDGNGIPIAGMPYHITDESGNTYKGLTDPNGCCQRIHTDSAQSLAILTGVPALEQWR